MHNEDRWRWLIWLSVSEVGTMLVFANYSAVLPILQKEWTLTNGQAGWIYSSYQIGYTIAVVALTSLTDYFNPKYIYVLSASWAGIAGIFFSLGAEGFASALILRTLMGVGLAGTYMPGLRMAAEKFPPHERGKALGIYVAAFSLGVAGSLFLTGMLNSRLSWRWAFLLTSLGPLAGGMIAVFRLGTIAAGNRGGKQNIPLSNILQNKPAVVMIGVYVAHMWEMFGMRGWLVTFLTACLMTSQYALSDAVRLSTVIMGLVILLGAVSNALGGALSDRWGRDRTIIVMLAGSGLLSLAIGWTRPLPFSLVLILCVLYGFLVAGDSAAISARVTELALPGGLGRTMALQSLLGFGAASLSPIVFGYVLDLTNPPDALNRWGFVPNWGWAFMVLGGGGLIGPLIIGRLKKYAAR